MGYLHEITRCPYSQEELDAAQESLGNIMEAADDDFYITLFNLEEDFLLVGEEEVFDSNVAKMFNITEEELIGHPKEDEMRDAFASYHTKLFAESLAKELNLSNVEGWALAGLCIHSLSYRTGLVDMLGSKLPPEVLN